MERSQEFKDKLNTLPSMPGVYLMKNSSGKIIYVGKSKCLKNRVSSYFHSSGLNIKTQKLVSNIFDFDIIVTRNEPEALVLENELIKRHNPKYNIKLKDAKTYPYIKMSVIGGFPKLELSRKRGNNDGKYFGPYTSSYAVNDIIKTIQKIFRIPDCDKKFVHGKRICRPCLSYHLDNCLAPCTGNIKSEEYSDIIRQIELFLRGDSKGAVSILEEKMMAASETMRFEEAAKYRDSIKNLKILSEKQNVVSTPKNEEDVFGYSESDVMSCITVLKIRSGIVQDKECIFLSTDEINDSEALSDLVLRYYDNFDMIPRSIYLSFDIDTETEAELSETLSLLSGHSVTVHHPERGDKRALCNIAVNNSTEAINTRTAILSNNEELLINVANLLCLEVLPERIESYDISNSGNSSMYCGMIVLENGKFKKSDYRSFAIKETAGQDDYAAMAEALKRRLLHIGADDDTSMNTTPDLILLDGGAGHVNTIKNLLSEMNLTIPVFGMVKDEHHKTRTITDGDNEISIARNQEMFNFFYKIQEEVHRYTFSKMDASRRKGVKCSSLAEIDGIGPAKAKLLLGHFGTLTAIKKASLKELTAVSGISSAIAENIFNHFNKQEN
ncbi:MAG: excinuclease ABC subunit UvrC [Clostridia bacterium]|nr:excinuclease ABC subunit UvrC [Clostridia bacterium]